MDAHRFDTVAKLLADRRLSRRTALARGSAGLATGALAAAGLAAAVPSAAAGQDATAATNAEDMPATGEAVPELAGFDRTMTELMARWELPGGQLAVAMDGRLVLNRGYGLADIEAGEPVQPDALFRIASIAKAFTTVAILALVEDGQLSLQDRAFSLLDLTPPANAAVDPRLADITIEHLLVHAGGWDSVASFEPQGLPWSGLAAHVFGAPQPASAESLVRFMLGFPLDFDPGSRSAYSNLGFNVLGRVIERVSGETYDAFVRHRILAPAGIEAMRLGRTRREDRAPCEVSYYAPADAPLLPSVFPGEGFSPLPYGAFFLESYDSHGGWLASAGDLVRFATAVDGQRGEPLLAPASVETMLHTPRPSVTVGGSGGAFGLGWEATPTADGVEWSRDGGLPGSTAARVVRAPDGLAFSFVFNSLPLAWPDFFSEAEAAVRGAAADVETWPDHDLFLA